MEELEIRGNIVQEKLWSKIPTLIKPIPLRAEATTFQPWQKPSTSLHKLATIPENDHILTEENSDTCNEAQTNIEQEMESKFKRIISNRRAAQRSRLRKLAYIEELENKLKSYERKKEVLHGEIAEQRKKQVLLQIEHHTFKFHMATREKQRILQEVEIEKNRGEVDRMLEVQRRMIESQKLRLHSNAFS